VTHFASKDPLPLAISPLAPFSVYCTYLLATLSVALRVWYSATAATSVYRDHKEQDTNSRIKVVGVNVSE